MRERRVRWEHTGGGRVRECRVGMVRGALPIAAADGAFCWLSIFSRAEATAVERDLRPTTLPSTTPREATAGASAVVRRL